MPNLNPFHAQSLKQGLNLLRLDPEVRQAIEAFLDANIQAGQVDELQVQLQSLPPERQANIAAIGQKMTSFNRGMINRANQLLADIPDELFASAASEAGLDD